MGEVLATPACLLGLLGPWGRFQPGELRLADGLVTFTPDHRGDGGGRRPAQIHLPCSASRPVR